MRDTLIAETSSNEEYPFSHLAGRDVPLAELFSNKGYPNGRII